MTKPDRFTTPYSNGTTADDVIDGVDLTGRRAIVTGGASGIGMETARTLASAGAMVTLAVRNMAAGERVAAEIAAGTGNRAVDVTALELADIRSVTAFAAAWRGPLHILINNAGIMALPELHRTREGWELQFATNHMGHFALTVGLHQALTDAGGARIVSVSSNAHRLSPIVFDDIHFQHRRYDPWLAYGQSKTANVLFAVEAAERWACDGITANALMPGAIRTNLQRHQPANMFPEIQAIFDNTRWITPQQGAATSVLLAASPLVQGITGCYFEACNEAEITCDPHAHTGVRPHAVDKRDAVRLWEVSSALISG
jgi:NAD(P)-dependent dehydrogenase (short-subunit alcohol dehydrogenase family)